MFDGPTVKWIYAAIAVLWVAIVLHSAWNVKGPEDFVVTVPQDEVQDFARVTLDSMQARSFAQNVELCAIIFEDSTGNLGASEPMAGDEATCDLRFFDKPGMAPVASIHTHGAFSQDYDSEVPSLIDLEGDIDSQFDGYVSTPGGRLWRNDWQQERAVLVCGKGCLKQDPGYRPCSEDAIASAYTLPQLAARMRQPVDKC